MFVAGGADDWAGLKKSNEPDAAVGWVVVEGPNIELPAVVVDGAVVTAGVNSEVELVGFAPKLKG